MSTILIQDVGGPTRICYTPLYDLTFTPDAYFEIKNTSDEFQSHNNIYFQNSV